MTYTRAAVERAMKVQEVILRALSGRQSWLQVADVLGLSPRTVRRLRLRYQKVGYDGLFDHRRRRSPRAVPVAELERVLRLYRERYGPRDGHPGFNVRHFCDVVRRDHQVQLSYSFIKQALQAAGLVAKRRARGRHRRRREPRPCLGELLHLDGSRHRWLALLPDAWHTLLAVVDDATNNELRVARISTVLAANRYLRERFMPEYNARFTRPPADPASAFVGIGRYDLEQIFCHQEERIVARDNTVSFGRFVFQIDKQRGRRSCAGLRVLVRRHLDRTYSVWWGPRRLGRYSAIGRALNPAA